MSEQIVAVLGVDLGKNSVSLAGLDAAGSVVVRKRTTRDGAIKRQTAILRRGNGGMLRRPLHGSDHGSPGAHDPADVSRVREALCQGPEDRRS